MRRNRAANAEAGEEGCLHILSMPCKENDATGEAYDYFS